MRDFTETYITLDQRARATITVTDFAALAGKVVTLDGTAKTEGANWTAATSNAATATSLATALDAIAGFDAVAADAIVTVYYTTPGTGGNAKTLTTDAASGLTLSGATLADGVAATYSQTFDYSGQDEQTKIETSLSVTALAGSSPTADVTPQFSYDKLTWFDSTAFTQKTAAGTQSLVMSQSALYTRFKVVIGGTNPLLTAKIFAVAK